MKIEELKLIQSYGKILERNGLGKVKEHPLMIPSSSTIKVKYQ